MIPADNVIVHLNVKQPIGRVSPGRMVILSGDAPVWEYCNLAYQCIMEGAAVVAIGHGVDVTTDADSSVVAYSTSSRFHIGKTL
ncbi:MAG: hypothetical protein FWE67_09410, partial [Planctomycetaceae bacterium]|nr:hypothetical protein [Planctomycetaceae bacterium]